MTAGLARRLKRKAEKIGRDTEAARLGGDVVASENEPAVGTHRFGNDLGNGAPAGRGILQLAGFERAEIDATGIHSGPQRPAGVELALQIKLRAKRKFAVRIETLLD